MYSLRQALRPSILAAFVLALALGMTAAASGAPTLSIDSGPTGPTRDTTLEFEFSAGAEATVVECSIDQGVPTYDACSHAGKHSNETPLADGDYTFRVRAIDAGLEETVLTRAFTVDTVAPTASIVSGPTGPIRDNAPTFAISGEAGADLECSVDQGDIDFQPCASASAHTPATLPDGSYTFRLRAVDAAGNSSPVATRTFRVDTLAPETTIESQPLGTTDDRTPTFEFSASEGGVDFECRLDSPTFTACDSPKLYGPLAEGPHTFAVRATDAVGNEGEEEVESFTIDLTNPELAIVSGPDGPTNDDAPEFEFEAENGTDVECSIDQGAPVWGECDTDDSHAAPAPLADGAYTFRVRATDIADNVTDETQDFVVDTVAPDTTIGAGPTDPTNSPNPSFTFGSNEAGVSFECRRDDEDFAPCTTPKAYENLPDGDHRFYVYAEDAAGNVDLSEDEREFFVDTVAPTVSITFGPAGTTSDDSPLFEFAAGGQTTTECSIDQGTPSYGACSSGSSHVVTRRLAAGAYTFRVRVSDLAGNTATATRSFTVATAATTGPAANPPAAPAPPTIATIPRPLSPFPLVRLSGRLTRLGAKVQILTVRAPAGSLVRVRVRPRCAKGARCAAKQASGKIARNGLLRFKQLELGYRAGTTIEVRVSRTGLIGKYTRFAIRRGKGPQRVDRCLMPGSTRASRCPAA